MSLLVGNGGRRQPVFREEEGVCATLLLDLGPRAELVCGDDAMMSSTGFKSTGPARPEPRRAAVWLESGMAATGHMS